jgi:hypothetical protein
MAKREKVKGSSLDSERFDQNQGYERPDYLGPDERDVWQGSLYTSFSGGVGRRDQYSRNPITNETTKIKYEDPFPYTNYPGRNWPNTPINEPSRARRSTMGYPPIYDDHSGNVEGEED